ncbi:MAG TPA: NADH-ubiquinone oxidoreductase-F iron-sulfur binding region domain-containing protein [Elusimicrobiales bacterium]|nr:NADH-ubiquinone oxidoreductase-F iron-sulfur binding region domain-containing protein [Elusimicrobiales bacterium]
MKTANEYTFTNLKAGAGLDAALKAGRTGVISELREAGLRGRGGAGFPTATKWNLAAAASGEDKYVVCNADEGEPGTFKDREILTLRPDLVFEGMTVAAYACGASRGVLYLRGEYAFMRPALEAELEKRRSSGLLGADIKGVKGFDFDIRIMLGSGAYVCGEETALLESIEGRRGEPRNRPPFPVSSGLDGAPTVVNNVETLVLACAALANGAAWFKGMGTEKSPGPKLFSVSGDVKRPGVYEFPFGVTIKEVLKAAGGEGARAAIVGGASGYCAPAPEFGRRICYEDIPTGGSFLALGPERSIPAAAENLLEFFAEESCGQCVPCRLGCAALLKGLRSGAPLAELVALGESMQVSAKCGLGQSAPNVFLSMARHFRKEFDRRKN